MNVIALGFRGIPGIQGGVESHAENLYPLLVELGCRVTVIGRRGYSKKAEHRGVEIKTLFAPRIAALEALTHTFIGIQWAAARRPDVLHIHGIGPGLLTPLARRMGLRVVFTHHGMDYRREKWGPFAKRVLRHGERNAVRHANAVIAVNRQIQKDVQEIHGVQASLIPNGAPPCRRTDNLAPISQLGLAPGRYIVCVGRLVAEKRQLDLIHAFHALRSEIGPMSEWQLVIVGAADHASSYQQAVTRAAAQTPGVALAGFRTGAELASLYSHAGVFCLPSSHEGLPIALLEALSYGLPVVASDIDANMEFALPPKAYFPVGNIPALAAALRDAALRGCAQEEIKRRQTLVREHFNWAAIARQTLAVMKNAVNAP